MNSGRMDDGTPLRVDNTIVDQLLIARLELDPNGMSDDPEILTVTASLPPNQTVFEYLVGCWRRVNLARSALHKKGYNSADADVVKAFGVLDQLRDLLVSYAGLTLQDPSMFPQPTSPANSFDRKLLGPQELLLPLLSLSSSNPLGSSGPPTALSSVEVEPFIIDLARRFEEDGLEDVLGPVVLDIAKVVQADTGGLMGSATGTQSWRAGVGALEALVAVKSVAAMVRIPSVTSCTGETYSNVLFSCTHVDYKACGMESRCGDWTHYRIHISDWPSRTPRCFCT